MPRPKHDGTPARAPRRRRLTERMVDRARPEAAAYAIWDTRQRGLALRVQPTGQRSWKAVYSIHGRPRWLHIGDARAIGLADARRIAAQVAVAVFEGKDPVADKRAERGNLSFGELAQQYLDEHAKRRNKSWRQADRHVRRHLIPKWGNLDARSITRADVKRVIGGIEAPMLANLVLAAASAIFSWAIKQDVVATNPCKGVDRHATNSRERVLSDRELLLFWRAFDGAGLLRASALRLILLTGQRPGEVCHMRREHLRDGWWEMPGKPDMATGWPGTKNGASHRVWLPEAAWDIIAELMDGEAPTGFVLASQRGGPVGDLAGAMRAMCKAIGAERITPHDLRRTHGTTITGLGFGREAMNRIQNHREGGIADVYDRHRYEAENRRITEAVAAHIVAIAEGRQRPDNVVRLQT